MRNNQEPSWGELMFALALPILGIPYKGWVFSVLWGWFVVGTFGLPALSIAQAIGLAMVTAMLTSHHSANSDAKERTRLELVLTSFAYTFVTPTFTLITAFVVSLFL